MAKAEKHQGKRKEATPGTSIPTTPGPQTPATGSGGASPTKEPTASSLPVMVRWLFSATVRHATAMRKHVLKILNHQRDVLSVPAVEAVEAAMAECFQAVATGADKAKLEAQMENLESVANKWLKPYPHAAWRENVEVLLVALTVAMGIRTFFLQPFKIPTGSMQPTLYGVTSQNLINEPNYKIPTGLERIRQWFAGVSYIHVVAKADGPVERVESPTRFLIFNICQKLVAGGQTFLLWFPPDYGAPPAGTLEARAGLQYGKVYRKGEDIIRLRVDAGDHLFVDRMTYNFRPPHRGEIIVFETKGIESLPQDQFYIKRMVAMGGDQVQIGDDRHLIINGKRLDASTPHFENVYSFDPKRDPMESHYSGHVRTPAYLAPYFQDKPEGVKVAPDHFMVMGDNTLNSLDSRAWGDFPATNVIGKAFFVYWPITDRFGWGIR